MAKSKIIEAVAWIRKYFVAASVERGLELNIKMGIMASMLISKPAHIRIKWLLRMVMIDPTKIVSKMMVSARMLISTGRVRPTFSGYGPDSFNLADLTWICRIWCNGSTKVFETLGIGSMPEVLETRGLDLYFLLYQSNSVVGHVSMCMVGCLL